MNPYEEKLIKAMIEYAYASYVLERIKQLHKNNKLGLFIGYCA